MSTVPGAFAVATQCRCRAAMTPGGKFQEHTITRRACSETDVAIDIQYAGICHSDIHTMREEWGPCIFPVVPGHEIAGVVVGVGSKVKNFTVGQRVGVGCMVGSCGECNNCKRGVEQYCEKGMIGTYNSRQRYPHMAEYDAETGGAPTYGGYSKSIVVDQGFVLHIPDNLDMAAAAPLLCAGITTYSPFMHYGLRPNHKVAILGLGGLGHMGAKFAVAMGCDVTIISRGTAKRESALNDLKVHHYLDSKDPAQLKAATNSFDFILDTVSADHDINMYVGLLNTDGKICIVGAPPATEKFAVRASTLFLGRRTMCGSLIGGVKETQEMLDFCGRHNITCDIELISADEIDKAYERTVNSDVKYRFVIDAATI